MVFNEKRGVKVYEKVVFFKESLFYKVVFLKVIVVVYINESSVSI